MGNILITGASRGIGAATVKALAAKGHNLCINYNKRKDKAGILLPHGFVYRRGGWPVAIVRSGPI